MFGWLLNIAYLALLTAVSPWIVFQILVRGKYRQGWNEKLTGRVPIPNGLPSKRVWFHAVSVGEVLLLAPVLKRFRETQPDAAIWISVTTHTGHAVAREKYPDCRIIYFPLDFTWAVKTALRRVQPSLVVLVELELWPNFIRQVAARQIPLVLINGRMSERSFRGYSRIRLLMKSLLGRFDRLGMQTDEYAERLKSLGAPADKVEVTGSVKFDGLYADRGNPKTAALRDAFQLTPDHRVLIAGSTQDPEEELALATYAALLPEFPQLRLILVPRHKERFEEVTRLVLAKGFRLHRRSTGQVKGSSPHPPVIELDTLGELGACWGLADVAFVGGSLTNRGGQNMMEPSAYGAAVLFGPNTQNFKQVVELLLTQNAALVVRSGEELTETVRRLLSNPGETRRLGEAAQRLVLAQQGATERTVRLLNDTLSAARLRKD
jgi:3-deoxy-D-manno-octulosonic-acid transferase